MKIARSRPRLLPLLPPLLGGRPAAPAFGALSWAGMLVTLVRYINDGNMRKSALDNEAGRGGRGHEAEATQHGARGRGGREQHAAAGENR